MAVLAEALSTGGEGHTHLLPFGVAREGDEQIGFAIAAHHGHAILVPLRPLPWPFQINFSIHEMVLKYWYVL